MDSKLLAEAAKALRKFYAMGEISRLDQPDSDPSEKLVEEVMEGWYSAIRAVIKIPAITSEGLAAKGAVLRAVMADAFEGQAGYEEIHNELSWSVALDIRRMSYKPNAESFRRYRIKWEDAVESLQPDGRHFCREFGH